ncbi:MAG: GNAT family N-acetyltransferase [Bacillota bacterium]
MVGRIERSDYSPAIGYLRPFRISSKVLTILYQGFIGHVNEEIARAVVQQVNNTLATGEADMVVFHHLCESSSLFQALQTAMDSSRGLTSGWSAHWDMDIGENPGFVVKKLRGKHRSWLRGRQKQLELAFLGKVSWRWISHCEDIPELCAKLERVAINTYQRGLGVGFVDDEEHRRRLSLFESRGQLRVLALNIEEEFRAFWTGLVYKGVFHSAETGYDTDLKGYEPGTLVFLRMLDELANEGIQKLDFGLGDAAYKRRFGDRSWREATVHMFASTPKGSALRLYFEVCALIDGFARRILEKTGRTDKVKAYWRRHLIQTPRQRG